MHPQYKYTIKQVAGVFVRTINHWIYAFNATRAINNLQVKHPNRKYLLVPFNRLSERSE